MTVPIMRVTSDDVMRIPLGKRSLEESVAIKTGVEDAHGRRLPWSRTESVGEFPNPLPLRVRTQLRRTLGQAGKA
jgi:hypothetical protein